MESLEQIIKDLKKNILQYHTEIEKAVGIVGANKHIIAVSDINKEILLSNVARLVNRYVFKKISSPDIKILKDILIGGLENE